MARFLFGSVGLQMTYKAKYISVTLKTVKKKVTLTVDTTLNM